MKKKVFVSGFFDLLNSGHISFLKEASEYGTLYVGIGSDKTFEELKGRSPVCSEQERLYMVKSIRHVGDAFINSGSGKLDFISLLDRIKPDILVVNADGGNELKKLLCSQRGIEYIELGTTPGTLSGASNSHTRSQNSKCHLPYRIDIAGTWIDQPYVSKYGAGWAITASIEPTHEFMERGGMSTSTRNAARKIWPYELPAYNEEMLARLLFCF
ncbi:MAG: adenylyltransferase/cytidyltransferase family protein, partial [Muribaculaceae bacterium]|nr:adenylyltransferase/cytidyltransferase family protein [Muribaculaceae bacterium]